MEYGSDYLARGIFYNDFTRPAISRGKNNQNYWISKMPTKIYESDYYFSSRPTSNFNLLLSNVFLSFFLRIRVDYRICIFCKVFCVYCHAMCTHNGAFMLGFFLVITIRIHRCLLLRMHDLKSRKCACTAAIGSKDIFKMRLYLFVPCFSQYANVA